MAEGHAVARWGDALLLLVGETVRAIQTPPRWRERATNYATGSIDDYVARREPLVAYWKSLNGKQTGDPARLARAIITIASQSPPPRRFIAGADAIGGAEQKIGALKEDIESNRPLSTSLNIDN